MIRMLPTFKEWRACYILAWVLYFGLTTGPQLHQLAMYHNLTLNHCATYFLNNFFFWFIVSVVGCVVATVLAAVLAITGPAQLTAKYFPRTCALVFAFALVLSAFITTGDLSIDHGCV